MQRTLIMFIFAWALSLAVSSTTTVMAQSAGSREDEEAIRQIIAEMTEGFNKHDATAATRMYTPDADLVTVRGEVMKGAADMEQGLAAIFATRAKEATLQTVGSHSGPVRRQALPRGSLRSRLAPSYTPCHAAA
jgi:t-SNARE complex subunit (syntaxin)